MVSFSRSLPQQFDQPLPTMMAGLTPGEPANRRIGEWADWGASPTPSKLSAIETLTAGQIRTLADAVAAWHLSSPLGICLRRSLLRYYFLRQAGLPVQIVFGARLKSNQEGGGIGGHAWLTLNNAPYFENPQDYAGFAPMYVYPVEDTSQTPNPPAQGVQIANRQS
jgi:hypothetical protein